MAEKEGFESAFKLKIISKTLAILRRVTIVWQNINTKKSSK